MTKQTFLATTAAAVAIAMSAVLAPAEVGADAWTAVAINPQPIAQPGVLAASTTIHLCVQPEDAQGGGVSESAVYLEFWSGVDVTQGGAHGGTAKVGATSLNTTPASFATQASCSFDVPGGGTGTTSDAVPVTYTSPPALPSSSEPPSHGRDVLTAASSTNDFALDGDCNGGVCANAMYVFSPITTFDFGSAPCAEGGGGVCAFAAAGSLAASQQLDVPITAMSAAPNAMAIPYAQFDVQLTLSSANETGTCPTSLGSATISDTAGAHAFPSCTDPAPLLVTAAQDGSVTAHLHAGPRQGEGVVTFSASVPSCGRYTTCAAGTGAYQYGPAPIDALVLDAYGGTHYLGSNAVVGRDTAYFCCPPLSLARAVVYRAIPGAGGTVTGGGYVLDAWGGLHAVGASPEIGTSSFYRKGVDIYRALALRADGVSGYVLDGYGGLHPFGGAPSVTDSLWTPGTDQAVGIALRSNGTSGWVLDAGGGLHACGGAPAASGVAFGFRIARAITLDSDSGGYILDGYGGIHAFGAAPALRDSFYASGWDIARSIAEYASGAGYVVDGFGGLHQFGTAVATPAAYGAYWPGQDIVRGLSVIP